MEVYRHICEVDVGAEGVKGAKNFFEAKVPFFTYIQLLAQQVCPRNHVCDCIYACASVKHALLIRELKPTYYCQCNYFNSCLFLEF